MIHRRIMFRTRIVGHGDFTLRRTRVNMDFCTQQKHSCPVHSGGHWWFVFPVAAQNFYERWKAGTR